MKRIERNNPPWKLATKFWWAQSWRALLLSVTITYPFGYIIGMTLFYCGVEVEEYEWIPILLGWSIGMLCSLWSTRVCFGIGKFKTFKVTIEEVKNPS